MCLSLDDMTTSCCDCRYVLHQPYKPLLLQLAYQRDLLVFGSNFEAWGLAPRQRVSQLSFKEEEDDDDKYTNWNCNNRNNDHNKNGNKS